MPRLPRRILLLSGAILLPSLGLSGCAPDALPGPQGGAVLPPDAVVGAGDPTRAAILNTAYAFASPANLAGRPAEAAQSVANFEYLTVAIPTDPRYREFSPLVAINLVDGRAELRQALGIAPSALPQAVIDALYAAARALRAGDMVAAERLLVPPNFTLGGAATLGRLAAMPAAPKANFAASLAQAEMTRVDQQGRGPGGRIGPGGIR